MRATVRLRLTALYGGLFLAAGAVLLTITYLLTAARLEQYTPGSNFRISAPSAPPEVQARLANVSQEIRNALGAQVGAQRGDTLRQLLTQSGIALGIAAVIAVALGWVMAGRVLRPLRAITATARRLSTENLTQRINLRGPRDELKELADTFDAMLDRLGAAFDAQRRFIANASHELRTPLTVQRAAVDVALANPAPSLESLRTMGERIRSAAQRQEHLIGSLLTLARSERGIDHFEPVGLAEVVRAALASASVASDVARLGLRVGCALAPVHVPGDRMLLERLVANLAENAARYNVAGGWIDVNVSAGPGEVTLRISNSGPVLPPDAASWLFEPFRRSGRDRAHGSGAHGGHGLGLSIVGAITTAHRGSYAARPRPDGGLDLMITLPAAP